MTFFFMWFQYGTTQELQKKHTVIKGETVYQISRKYNVSIAEIYKLNPNSESVIYVNDILIIPKINNGTTSNTNDVSSSLTNNSKEIIYTVKRGDTKYGLSKRIGISITSLEQQNPHIKKGLQAGHVLNINSKNNTSIQPSNEVVKLNNNTNTSHLVLKGETLYGISKKYNLSINELKEANSDVPTDILQTGVILKIPLSGQDVSNFTKDKYTVRKGDTKYGLSKKFNVTINELESSNPQIVTMLHYGITINVPSYSDKSLAKTISSEPENEASIVNDIPDLNQKTSEAIKAESETNNSDIKNNDIVNSTENYQNLTLSLNKTKKNDILFVFPFTNDEFNDYLAGNLEFKNVSDQFFIKNIEFYKGAKIAIDSAKSLGLNFKIDLLKINNGNKDDKLSLNEKTHNFEAYNSILSPYYLDESKSIANLVTNRNIPVVTTTSSTSLKKTNNLFEALPSIHFQKLKLIEYLNSKKGNIVLISDIDREVNRNFILEHTPDAKIIKTNKNGRITNKELVSKLDNANKNYIIIDSKRSRVFLNSTNLMLRELSNYSIQLAVLESSIIPDSKTISSKRYKVLNMIYPTINQSNNGSQISIFTENYKNSYNSEVTLDAIYGFDITLDFILRMSQSISFEETVKKNKTEYLTLKFDYRRSDSRKYFNNEVLILEYNKKTSFKEDE